MNNPLSVLWTAMTHIVTGTVLARRMRWAQCSAQLCPSVLENRINQQMHNDFHHELCEWLKPGTEEGRQTEAGGLGVREKSWWISHCQGRRGSVQNVHSWFLSNTRHPSFWTFLKLPVGRQVAQSHCQASPSRKLDLMSLGKGSRITGLWKLSRSPSVCLQGWECLASVLCGQESMQTGLSRF